MAFPEVATTLDSFTYAIVSDLDAYDSSRWAEAAPASTIGAFETTGDNRARCGVSFTGMSVYIGLPVMTDQEVTIELPVLGSSHQGVALRLREYGPAATTIDGYVVYRDGTNLIIAKMLNGTPTALQTTPQTFAAGDAIGASAIGSTIRAYRKTGGVWTQVGANVTDASYPDGRIGLYGRLTDGIYDNFGGGSAVVVITTRVSFDFIGVYAPVLVVAAPTVHTYAQITATYPFYSSLTATGWDYATMKEH